MTRHIFPLAVSILAFSSVVLADPTSEAPRRPERMEAGWGEPVNGLRARLSPMRRVYFRGQSPTVRFDLMNVSEKDVYVRSLTEAAPADNPEFSIKVAGARGAGRRNISGAPVAWEPAKAVAIKPGKVVSMYRRLDGRPRLEKGEAYEVTAKFISPKHEFPPDDRLWRGSLTAKTLIRYGDYRTLSVKELIEQLPREHAPRPVSGELARRWKLPEIFQDSERHHSRAVSSPDGEYLCYYHSFALDGFGRPSSMGDQLLLVTNEGKVLWHREMRFGDGPVVSNTGTVAVGEWLRAPSVLRPHLIAPDGKDLWVFDPGLPERVVKGWDPRRHSMRPALGVVYAHNFSPDGQRYYFIYRRNEKSPPVLKCHDLAGKPLWRAELGKNAPVLADAIFISPDRKHVIVANVNRSPSTGFAVFTGEGKLRFIAPLFDWHVRFQFIEGERTVGERPIDRAPQVVIKSEKAMRTFLLDVPVAAPKGVVRLPDGRPAEDAELILVTPGSTANITGARREWPGPDRTRITGAGGRFEFPPTLVHYKLVALHESGYAEVTVKDPATQSTDLTLRPWGRVEGTFRIGNQPAAGRYVYVKALKKDSTGPLRTLYTGGAKTDAGGRFVIAKVRSGKLIIGPEDTVRKGDHILGRARLIEVKPGQTLRVTIGGRGHKVSGRLVAPPGTEGKVNWERAIARLFPVDGPVETYYTLTLSKDASFVAHDTPSGNYLLRFSVFYPETQQTFIPVPVKVTVPAKPGGEPLDLGTLKLFLNKRQADAAARQNARTGNPVQPTEAKGPGRALTSKERQARADGSRKATVLKLTRIRLSGGNDTGHGKEHSPWPMVCVAGALLPAFHMEQNRCPASRAQRKQHPAALTSPPWQPPQSPSPHPASFHPRR